MEIVTANLRCEECGIDFEFESKNRVELCEVVGSPHYGKVISWDSTHKPHDIPCPLCASVDKVRLI